MSKKPEDAQRIAGLAGILKQSNSQKDVPSPAPPQAAVIETATAPPSPVAARKDKPLSKKADPAWKHYGIHVRIATHKRARRHLEDTKPDWDMSDLVEHLLDQWVKSTSN